MSGIASKNLFELLGNDPELDPDRAPDPPAKAIEKPVARAGKRNTPAEPPVRDARASRGGNNDGGFRNRGGEGNQNRSRASGESGESGYRGRGGRGRGGRGRGGNGDRHSRTGIAEHDKQTAHGWGGQTGGDEWADEKAGEAIAKEEEKAEGVVSSDQAWNADAQPADPFAHENAGAEAAAPAEEPEEDKTKSYTAWLAEQAEKKLNLSSPEVRKPNEGSTKKFPEGKPLTKEEEEEYVAGSGGKAKRERQRKEKTIVELDNERLHKEPSDSFRGGRGGRGRGRGEGSFRGEGRGRGGRGRGEGRGDFRGGRGGRGGQSAAVNLSDPSAFPSLGS
ncbi:uncharacterized protein BDZ99DRAFT_565312 [Mytilinidion resinicola]|uniref:Hyaluronan/mRNA-binding protein domain-containing protein n=1 Tax=Mytilinidion resinicola TaxID=574789 RepID=A0A6A6Z982_9PEZI|nr:uncharacterized protein BDZ99DRAFT_565312 [Mytilinidion resinicola]KAF2817590.1 hypothetical protein BDZ99DRAFT_565312 [Mytilinidion resinicola]